jgi:DUF971 family protein
MSDGLAAADPLADPWPESITYDPTAKILHVAFDTGESFALPAEYLRVESPSAEVQGHNPAEKQIVPGRSQVGLINIETVGNYAVRLIFDDLHDTGIYSWRYLYELGRDQPARWQLYLHALAQRGLSRDP